VEAQIKINITYTRGWGTGSNQNIQHFITTYDDNVFGMISCFAKPALLENWCQSFLRELSFSSTDLLHTETCIVWSLC